MPRPLFTFLPPTDTPLWIEIEIEVERGLQRQKVKTPNKRLVGRKLCPTVIKNKFTETGTSLFFCKFTVTENHDVLYPLNRVINLYCTHFRTLGPILSVNPLPAEPTSQNFFIDPTYSLVDVSLLIFICTTVRFERSSLYILDKLLNPNLLTRRGWFLCYYLYLLSHTKVFEVPYYGKPSFSYLGQVPTDTKVYVHANI